MTKETELLINHLTKEIELANQQLIEQRTKNNLWIAFGPFLLLGGLAANQGALDAFRKCESWILVNIGVLSILAYAALGVLAAAIEKHIWDRGNQCREQLAKLTDFDPNNLKFSTKWIFWMYSLIFASLGCVFVGLGIMLRAIK